MTPAFNPLTNTPEAVGIFLAATGVDAYTVMRWLDARLPPAVADAILESYETERMRATLAD